MEIVETKLADGSPVFTLETKMKNDEGKTGVLVIECEDKQQALLGARFFNRVIDVYFKPDEQTKS